MSVEERLHETGCVLEMLRVIQRYYPTVQCDIFRGGVHNDVVIRMNRTQYCFSLSHFSGESTATLALYVYTEDNKQEVFREVIDTFFIHTKVKEAIDNNLRDVN
jgi:hypothetical protein